MPRQYYLRFVAMPPHVCRGPTDGALQCAFELAKKAGVDKDDRRTLEDMLGWFSKELPAPDRFSRSRSKGHYRRYTKGVCWFKPSATEAIRQMRGIAELLSRYGYAVEERRTTRPGFVVYEDEQQLVAEPFSETPQ